MPHENIYQQLGVFMLYFRSSARKVLLFTSILAMPQVSYAETARGIVFDDRNANGARDTGEPGLTGVRVSNGRDIVATDASGRYALEIDQDDIVFVIKPRDWSTRFNNYHMPQFYYIHKPAGSPDDDFVHAGVEPTGPLPESIEFPLTHSPEPLKFTMIVMGDPQPTTQREVRFYANDVIAELVDTTAQLGISLGDIVGDDLALFDSVNAVQAVVGVPWYNVLGNHDMNLQSLSDEYADETFERVYGPPNYAFQYGQVHFLVLDNVEYQGMTVDEKGQPQKGSYRGHLTDCQLEFVANFVAGVPVDERIVVCTHIPLPEIPTGMGETHRISDLRRLLEILSNHPYTMSFSAHTHINEHSFLGPEQGYQHGAGDAEHHHHNVVTGSGSWYRGELDEAGFPVTTMADGAPNGYIRATFDGNQYRLRYKAARLPEHYQLVIRAPEVVDHNETSASEIVVNVFNGSSKSKVRMRVREQCDWVAMFHSPGQDPFYKKMHQRDAALAGDDRKPIPEPAQTSHLWRANLPAGLPPGVHVLDVESTDMFGQIDRGIRLIEVTFLQEEPHQLP